MGTFCGRGIRVSWKLFLRSVRFMTGDGKRVRFWYDLWCGEELLRDRFPDSFSLSLEKEASVETCMTFTENGVCGSVRGILF